MNKYFIQKRLKPYLSDISAKNDFTLLNGNISCCGHHNFEVLYNGSIVKNIFGKSYLIGNKPVFEAKCKICESKIRIFDSNTDGYDNCDTKTDATNATLTSFICPKCNTSDFEVKVSFEYLSKDDLDDEGIVDYGNSFTCIWISICCNNCGKKIKNFLVFETG
ncbi:MAG: hypothetical protein IJA17_03000 [Oscillospiraceae bacterium]|nr:hypothetical protein [Oscillospiraceae bacterium]